VAEGRQRNRGFFSGMLRGVSDPCEGSKILIFLSWAPSGVQLASTSQKLEEGEFCEMLPWLSAQNSPTIQEARSPTLRR
jgi:hypothetical protein